MHSHEGDPGSINAWVRVYEEDALAAAARADERLGESAVRRDGAAPPLTGRPDRAQGSLRRRRQAAHRLEQAAPRTCPTEDCDVWRQPFGRGHGAPRPSPHPRVRRRRHDGPGREPVGARPLGRGVERRLGGRARGANGARGDGDRHRRLAAHPLGVLRHVCDQADARPRLDAPGSCRSPGASTTPGRWRARSPTARCSSRRWPGPTGAERRPRCTPSPLRAHGGAPLAGARVAVSPRLASAELDADVAAGLERRARRVPAARRRARRAAGTAPDLARDRRRRRLPRRADDGDARLPPPLRRPTRRLPAVAPRVGREG